MGWDPTPFFVNLFLHYYEGRWICQLRKLDIEFERSCKEIYSFELAPRKENIDSVL